MNLANKINNASSEELTLMLYQGCEDFLVQGINYMKQKDFEKANKFIQRAEGIISEFRCTLNYQYEISYQLNDLYIFIYESLVNGNIKNDIKMLTDALEIIQALKTAWTEAIQLVKNH